MLSASDIRLFWRALAAMEAMTGEHMARAEKGRALSPATRSILRLLLLTGQWRGEVAGARKAELELDGDETARLGLPVHVRSPVLDHSPMSRGITDAVYNRYADDKEKREALMAWEGRLKALLAPAIEPASVPTHSLGTLLIGVGIGFRRPLPPNPTGIV